MNMLNTNSVDCRTHTVAVSLAQAIHLDNSVFGTWVTQSRLVLQGQAVRHAIEVHKWCESEKAGHDIGWEAATASWHAHHGHVPCPVPVPPTDPTGPETRN